jgi:1-phosphofructokinase
MHTDSAPAPVVTVTFNPAVDYTLTTERLDDGHVSRTDEARFDPGGKGINVAGYLSALDVRAVATGLVGGFTGSFIRTRLDDDGLAHDFVPVSGITRVNVTLSTPDGEYKINHDGPTVDADAVARVVERIEAYDPETVVVGGSLPPGLDTGAVDAVAEAGPWETVVDVDGAALEELRASYAACKPNREELHGATGLPVDTVDDCVAAAEALRREGYDRVVASLGPDGALLVSDAGTTHVPAADVDVVDTVGAGDALLSGVLCGWVRGYSDEAALRLGVDVATRVVGTAGTAAGVVADADSTGEDSDDRGVRAS